ncbi:MAG TPA: IclR family transcriptional regulator [Roseomonas sp.]|jgi:DNA-binding IclR family transcriptional regulator
MAEPGMAGGVAAGDRGVEQTFGRAAAVLDALADAREGGLRFTDLVGATGFSKATVHRLMAGLSAHGLVEADPGSGRYFLGFRLAAWGAAARDRHGLAERAAPALRRLAEQTGDTVYLSLRIGVLSLCVARHEGSFPIRALPLKPGDRNALGVGSGSLAMLAFLEPEAAIERVLADPENIAARERRGIDEAHVRRHVAATRRKGHTFVDDLTPGMIGMGLPVPGRGGQPVAAVSIATISARLRQPRRKAVLEHLAQAVREIRGILGEAPGLEFAR